MHSVLCSAARMATAQTSASAQDKNDERRRRVMLGPLPSGFLEPEGRALTSAEQQEAADRQAALALQQQLCEGQAPPRQAVTGRLSITLAQAKLVKNYGMTRMDPYVRLRVGHCIYETHTDPNGGKNPRWNKVIHCLLPPGVNSIYLEIFDECSFTMDELIAWAHITIPPAVMQGETHEDWYPLTGKQGDGMEGMVNLVLSYSLAPAATLSYAGIPNAYPPVMMVPNSALGYTPMAVYPAPVSGVPIAQPAMQRPPSPAQAAIPTPRNTLSEDEIKLIEEMFPSIEKEVIKTVIEANRGNKDSTINCLLQMSE